MEAFDYEQAVFLYEHGDLSDKLSVIKEAVPYTKTNKAETNSKEAKIFIAERLRDLRISGEEGALSDALFSAFYGFMNGYVRDRVNKYYKKNLPGLQGAVLEERKENAMQEVWAFILSTIDKYDPDIMFKNGSENPVRVCVTTYYKDYILNGAIQDAEASEKNGVKNRANLNLDAVVKVAKETLATELKREPFHYEIMNRVNEGRAQKIGIGQVRICLARISGNDTLSSLDAIKLDNDNDDTVNLANAYEQATFDGPEQKAIRDQERAALFTALGHLNKTELAAVLYFAGLKICDNELVLAENRPSLSSFSRIHKISTSAVRTIYQEALAKLRTELAPYRTTRSIGHDNSDMAAMIFFNQADDDLWMDDFEGIATTFRENRGEVS